MVAADRKAGKDSAARVRHEQDDVRLPHEVDLSQGDQTVEAILKHRSPRS